MTNTSIDIDPSRTAARDWEDDGFHDRVVPREGFVYPAVGAKVKCLQDHRVPSHETIPSGTWGTVTEVRLPGSFQQQQGYIGCGIYWPCLKKYPVGIIIRWDEISDHARFQFSESSAQIHSRASRYAAP